VREVLPGEAPIPERSDLLIEVGAGPRHFGLGDPGVRTRRFDQWGQPFLHESAASGSRDQHQVFVGRRVEYSPLVRVRFRLPCDVSGSIHAHTTGRPSLGRSFPAPHPAPLTIPAEAKRPTYLNDLDGHRLL
jgi:hypothetical protein